MPSSSAWNWVLSTRQHDEPLWERSVDKLEPPTFTRFDPPAKIAKLDSVNVCNECAECDPPARHSSERIKKLECIVSAKRKSKPKEEPKQQEVCVICLDELHTQPCAGLYSSRAVCSAQNRTGPFRQVRACRHVFHECCAKRLDTSLGCPLCRASFGVVKRVNSSQTSTTALPRRQRVLNIIVQSVGLRG